MRTLIAIYSDERLFAAFMIGIVVGGMIAFASNVVAG